MTYFDKINKLLGLLDRMTIIQTEDQLQVWQTSFLKPNQVRILTFLNAHGVNVSMQNETFLGTYSYADAILRDGIGLKWMLKSQGREAGLNMNGTDYIPKILDTIKGQKLAIWGTQENVVHDVAKKLNASGHLVVSQENGFHKYEYYLDALYKEKPEIVLLGMGMPKQEQLAVMLKKQCQHPCLIICGGAIIDFLGSKVQRAPVWMRRMGLEWLFRLVQEPRRLFKRYVIGNFVFLIWMIKLKIQNPKNSTLC
jgi:N-acetylglucosaminyldiphosphoundecaprenol N-acetyl-beta-D-mannosaminyltransferase